MQARLRYWVDEMSEKQVTYKAMPFDLEVFANSIQARKLRAKKYRGPDSPLYSVLYPMICIIKFFGLAPYDFSRDQMVPSNAPLIFAVISSSMYLYEMYVIYIGFQTSHRDRIFGWTSTIMVAFNYFVTMYEIFLALFTRRSFVKVWNAIQDYDDAVRQLGYPRKELKTGIVAWAILLAQACVWTIVNLTGMYAFTERWFYNVAYMTIYFGSSVALYKFVGITLVLGQRFSHLTELAVKNLPPRSGFMKPGNVSRQRVQDLHNELMVAGERLDSMYRWSLFFWLANLSMHSVSNIYYIISWLLEPKFNESYIPLICCYTAWLMSFLLQLLLLHCACDITTKNANDIHIVLVDWNVRLAKRFPATEAVESSVHMLNRKLQFSAAGCFYVDLPLLRSIVAVLSTYLVILLQLPS